MMTRNVSMPLGQVNVAMNGSGANGALNNSKAANNKRRAFRVRNRLYMQNKNFDMLESESNFCCCFIGCYKSRW